MSLNKNLITNQKIIISDGIIGGERDWSDLISSLPKMTMDTDYKIEQTIGWFYLNKIDLNTAKYI